MNIRYVLGGFAALMLGGQAALAQAPAPAAPVAPAPPGSGMLAFMDRDGDGKVSLNDWLNVQLPKLAKFDTDADGMLSYAEFKESLEGPAKRDAERSFKLFDVETTRNKLTQREFLGYHAFVFKTFLDTNHDGELSQKEWDKLLAGLR